MVIRDLFRNEEASSILSNESLEEATAEAESEKYTEVYSKRKNRTIPHVDLYKPENFARYGSAEQYYRDSINRIIRTYPYDGSGYEKISWELSSSFLDLHIFQNEYPRTNGYVNLSAGGWGDRVALIGDYGATATSSYEYIHVSQSMNVNNVLKPSKGQSFNLELDPSSGTSVEFWLKKDAYVGASKSNKEIVFDLWNGAPSSSAEYGRFRAELSASATENDSPFRISYMSGALGFSDQMVGSSFTTASLLDSWNHYAFTVISGSSNLELKLYVNGKLNDTKTSAVDLGKVVSSGSQMTLGALVTSPSGNIYHDHGSDMKGWAKLSASVDEFRFWKTKRTSRDIGRNWFTQVDGGTNTDTANTDLGIYFKFNEGITGDSSTDSKVLDYSGRVSNGTWLGYLSSSRSTDSAIVSASAASFETKDPIIYFNHPDVKAYAAEKINIGIEHDYTNNSSIIKSVPGWIIEEDETTGADELKHLTQIIASYFDTLQLQIEVLPETRTIEYVSGSHVATGSFKPYPFTDRMLESLGFPSPELFADAEVLEFFKDRDEDRLYRDTIHDIKNLIYKNIYNNLIHIYKTKGTEKSFRNLFHCFGVDEELIRINLYADNETYTFEDRYLNAVEKKKYANFFNTGSFNATVFQQTSSAISDSLSYINGSETDLLEKDHAVTIEAECILPKLLKPANSGYFSVPLTCSLFGGHSALSDGANLAWNPSSTGDSGSFHVYAARVNSESANARFFLTSSQSNIPTLTSSIIVDAFDDRRWNLAVRIKPSKNRQAFIGTSEYTGSTPSTYDVEFYGVNPFLTNLDNKFFVTGTCDNMQGARFVSDRKRLFVGAHRTNFIGDVLQQSYAKISSLRYWMDYLDNETIDYHAKSPLNFGTPDPYKNAYFYENLGYTGDPTYLLTGSNYPQVKTLALHWSFADLTGSGPSAIQSFDVTDVSSGSSDTTSYGRIGEIALKHHPGVGYGFPTDHKKSITIEHVQSAKKRLPEVLNSYDMINIISGSQLEIFGRDERPISYFMSIEKSMYQNISEEMINLFSTISAFDNLIGEPVDRYRDNYKSLEKLRETFFSKVSNVPDVERFIDFYKWFDAALSKVIGDLIPVSARISDQVQNVIESHILERNKYRTKFPTLEVKLNDIEATMLGASSFMPVTPVTPPSAVRDAERFAGELWSHGFPPTPNSPLRQDINILWWRTRAERNQADISSNILAVDIDRQKIADSIFGTYQKKQQMPVRVAFTREEYIKPGVNFPTQKKYDFYKSTLNKFSNTSLVTDAMRISNREFASASVLKPEFPAIERVLDSDDYSDLISKERLIFEVNTVSSSVNASGDLLMPFSIYSSSATDGYVAGTSLGNYDYTISKYHGETTLYKKNDNIKLKITGLHEDVYGPNYERPLQGPFTRTHVGGMAHRTTFVNDGTDTEANRAEAWKIEITEPVFDSEVQTTKPLFILKPGGCASPNNPRVNFYKEGTARRPLNIKNIQYNTASKFLGNYQKDYEIVQTSNRRTNNRWFVDTEGGALESNTIDFENNSFSLNITASSLTVGGLLGYTKPVRARGKHVFVERFSAPGGPETMGDTDGGPGLDAVSAEYSIYNSLNYRNFNVRQVLHELSVQHAGVGGQSSFEQDTGSWYTASPSASFHKTNRNPRTKIIYADATTTTSFSTVTVYDNMYVQTPIPAQDYGYSWITASAIAPFIHGHATGSSDITFASASDYRAARYLNVPPSPGLLYFGVDISSAHPAVTDITSVDFVGLNSIVYESISSSENTLGYPNMTIFNNSLVAPSWYSSNYLNADFIAGTIWTGSRWGYGIIDSPGGVHGTTLNAIILHRQGPYGWPSWKQIRGRNHPIRRDEVKKNRFSIVKEEVQTHATADNRFSKTTTLKYYTEPNITSKHKYLSHEFSTRGGFSRENDQTQWRHALNFRVDHSYGNNKVRFANTDLSIELFGSENDNRTQMYDQLYEKYSDENLTSQPGAFLFENLIYREIVYPAEVNTYLSGTRSRAEFTYNHLWNSDRDLRTKANRVNEFSQTIGSESIWPLDARDNFLTALPSDDPNNTDGAGALQSAYVHWHSGSKSFLSGGAVYARRTQDWDLDTNLINGIIAGDTLWEAASQSGAEPYYTSYEAYAEVLRAQGKEYSIVPEFKISDHIEYFVDEKQNNFLSPRANLFSLTGACPQDSSYESFCKEYLHSDFLKYFDSIIKRDHDSDNASAITLTCKAYKKFLPYEGFYPAQRALEVASLFSSSYSSALTSSGPDSADDDISLAVKYRPIADALYAPGILFNSIKSGIAVDYPIHTGDYSVTASKYSIPSVLPNTRKGFFGIFDKADFRVPFEALLHPEFYFPDDIVDGEPHPSASLNLTSSFNSLKAPGPLYKMAINNFVSETMFFFLKRRGPGAIVSAPARRIRFNSSEYTRYAMEINIRKTSEFSLYDRASAFGPPAIVILQAKDDPSSIQTGSCFWPYTPSYFDTTEKSKAVILFPQDGVELENKDYSILDIIDSSSVSYIRSQVIDSNPDWIVAPGTDKFGNNDMMMLSSSVNLFSVLESTPASFTPTGLLESVSPGGSLTSPEYQWAISPKFECPALNFSSATVTTGTYGSSSLSQGIWHQYGSLPDADEGIYLSVNRYTEATDPLKTGSLADLLKFRRVDGGEPTVKVGEMMATDEYREVFEAVVAIPFMLNAKNVKEFFTIPREQIDYIETKINSGVPRASNDADYAGIPQDVIDNPPHETLEEIVKAMQKYVFPPPFNFLEFKEIKPLVMFVFEFNYKFSGQDLANIWQNLLPSENITRGPTPLGHSNHELDSYVDRSEISIVHPSLESAFFDPMKGVGKELRWMVFKVKQRAVSNYSDIVKLSMAGELANIRDPNLVRDVRRKVNHFELMRSMLTSQPATDANLKETRGYTYNWPYDYFSFVELISLEAEVAVSSVAEKEEVDALTPIYEGIN